jgi:hypothetical protein
MNKIIVVALALFLVLSMLFLTACEEVFSASRTTEDGFLTKKTTTKVCKLGECKVTTSRCGKWDKNC